MKTSSTTEPNQQKEIFSSIKGGGASLPGQWFNDLTTARFFLALLGLAK